MFTGAGVTAPPIFLWINESTLTYTREVVSSSGEPSGFLCTSKSFFNVAVAFWPGFNVYNKPAQAPPFVVATQMTGRPFIRPVVMNSSLSAE